jgi:hypothetical protein
MFDTALPLLATYFTDVDSLCKEEKMSNDRITDRLRAMGELHSSSVPRGMV